MDVYVLLTSDWDECGSDATVWGVFKTREEAEEYKKKQKLDQYYHNIIIEQHVLEV